MSLNCRNLFRGRIISLNRETHRLPSGRTVELETVRHPGGAAVLPLLPDGRLLLIRQLRPVVGETLWEIPAGRLDPGEMPDECVRRELQEETGYRAGRLQKLGEMLTAPGYCDETVHLFLAWQLSPVEGTPEEDEVIETAPISPEEAQAMVRRGEIRDGKTQLAILLYGAFDP